MESTTVTKRIDVNYAHALPEHLGLCSDVHGHLGVIEVTVEGPIQETGSSTGMVYDFKDLKKIMMEHIHDRLDHGFAVWVNDIKGISVNYSKLEGAAPFKISTKDFILARNERVVLTEEPPTAEFLAKWCYNQLKAHLPNEIKLVQVKFYETPNSYAIYKEN